MRPDAIVLHHSATPDGQTNDWEAIRRYHTSWRYNSRIVSQAIAMELIGMGKKVEPPWVEIGYHYGIEMVGNTYLVLSGRLEHTQGAHCNQGGMNRHSLGICFVGNFDLAPPPEPQWKQGVFLVSNLCKKYIIPVERIHGHREFAPKTCPGNLFDLFAFRADVTALL